MSFAASDDVLALRAIFDATPECIKIVAPDGTLLQINPAGRSMIEASDGMDVEGACIYDIIAPECREAWKINHARVCTGEKLSWEFDIIGFAGTRRNMETHAVPLQMPDGSIAQLAITRDVTRRKQDDAQIRESEHRYKQLLQALPAAVYTTDTEGRITFYNEAAVAFAGRRPEPGEQWCVTWRLFNLDGSPLPHAQCPMAVTLKEGRPVRGVEAIAERPDGTRVRFLPYPTPLYDISGRLAGAINLLIDLSDKYQAEVMSARLASIVASSDDAIVSETFEGEITSWNAGATRILGYEDSEIIGQNITRIIPPELHASEREVLERIKSGERVRSYETIRFAKNGRRVEISLTVSPLHDAWGAVIGVSRVARDITERKRTEELQQLLFEELNHRVKNTLATIQAIADQSLRHARDPHDFVSGFNGRVKALARAHDLLVQTKLQGTELMELVHEQVLLGITDDRIVCSGPSLTLSPQITVHLAMVLHELATNARKYGALSAPQGRLSVSWEVRTNGERSLFLQWEERNGPEVSAPRTADLGAL